MSLSVTPKILLPSVWPSPRSLATTSGISVDVFSSPYLDVSVQAVPLIQLCIHCMIPCGGFPHSDISGSQLICSSPKLFAAYHVLHRLLMPRHSPCALISLISSKQTPHFPHCSHCFRIAFNATLRRCFSSQIKTRFRWAFDLLFWNNVQSFALFVWITNSLIEISPIIGSH